MLQSTQERFLLVHIFINQNDVQIGNPNKDLNEEYQITPNQTQVDYHIYIGGCALEQAVKVFQYITADEPSQGSPEGLIQDSDNELAMGENVDLNEKFVCPPHEGLPIPTQAGFQGFDVE